MATYSLPRDANRVPSQGGVSAVDGATVLGLEVAAGSYPNTGILKVAASPAPPVPLSTFGTGQQVSAGVATALPTNACNGVAVRALSTNTGVIWVGDATVTAGTGYELTPGESLSLSISNTDAVYILAVVAGEGVCFAFNN